MEHGASLAYNRGLDYGSWGLYSYSRDKRYGFSVRLVRDN